MKKRGIRKEKIVKRRLIFSLAIIILITSGLIVLMGNGKTSSFIETKYKKVCVSSGETLWEIAKIELANNNYYFNDDIRAVVKDIKEINNLNNSNIYPGQELVIPCL